LNPRLTDRIARESQGGHNNVFRYTTEELHSIATPYATSSKAAELLPIQGSREATPSSGKETSPDVDIHNTKEGAMGSKKRRKHRCLGIHNHD
jgi:hypothetical protein